MERNLVISPQVSACTVLAVSKARFGEMVKKTRHLAPKVNERHVRESKIPTPWLTLLLVLGKSRVKQNSC